MKVMMLNGSPHAGGCTFTALSEIAKILSKYEITSEIIQIGVKPVPECIACGKCRDTGKCVFDDSVNQLLDKVDDFEGLVVGSPVYYAAPSAQVCAFLDRFFYAGGRRMVGKVAASVVSCRRGGASAAFDCLNKYFLMSNMIVVGSQYWNQVHGNNAEQVRLDLEGMQTMRALGENIAWLLRSLDAGKKAGIPVPSYEPRIATNFIR